MVSYFNSSQMGGKLENAFGEQKSNLGRVLAPQQFIGLSCNYNVIKIAICIKNTSLEEEEQGDYLGRELITQ